MSTQGYPQGQLAKAFVTALSHENPETRRLAEERLRRWLSVLDGMNTGTLTVGSRTPVAGLPAWVTPEVVRGGFATGAAAAGGRLEPYELKAINNAGVPADRSRLFAYYLTDAGLAELEQRLDSGTYRLNVPEEAALLVVAALLRLGDRIGALNLVETITPFADRLRFSPPPSDAVFLDPDIVYRATVSYTHQQVQQRQPNPRVEAMRETLSVWNPFGDELLALWQETVADGRVGAVVPDGWLDRAIRMRDRYLELAATHTRSTKHRKPKENLAILRTALEWVVSGRELLPRQRGLLQHAVDSMLRKRDSAAFVGLRDRQARDAARPAHYVLAQIVAARLAELPQDGGISTVEPLIAPAESGEPIPPAIQRVVRRGQAGTVEELIHSGVITSAEVLAQLTPRLAAATTARAYPPGPLGPLMAAHYQAFRNRRSLLLLNLEHQVRLGELPWVSALASHRIESDDTRAHARAVLVRLASLTVDGFPATILPNPMIRELSALAAEAGLDIPFVEELAADIFMGRFSAKFLRAAQVAAKVLQGSLYERYYGIDYAQIAGMEAPAAPQRRLRIRRAPAPSPAGFDELCKVRAKAPDGWVSVATNGTVIEQAQILTTHNLAALVELVPIAPTNSWPELAERCLRAVYRRTDQLRNNPRPLTTIKDAAYAWRQMIFFLSLATPAEQARFVGQLEDNVRLRPALAGLVHVHRGGSFDDQGAAGAARRFLGWTTASSRDRTDIGT